jgi:hypothetical protein
MNKLTHVQWLIAIGGELSARFTLFDSVSKVFENSTFYLNTGLSDETFGKFKLVLTSKGDEHQISLSTLYENFVFKQELHLVIKTDSIDKVFEVIKELVFGIHYRGNYKTFVGNYSDLLQKTEEKTNEG